MPNKNQKETLGSVDFLVFMRFRFSFVLYYEYDIIIATIIKNQVWVLYKFFALLVKISFNQH